jgi:hypothetical protein
VRTGREPHLAGPHPVHRQANSHAAGARRIQSHRSIVLRCLQCILDDPRILSTRAALSLRQRRRRTLWTGGRRGCCRRAYCRTQSRWSWRAQQYHNFAHHRGSRLRRSLALRQSHGWPHLRCHSSGLWSASWHVSNQTRIYGLLPEARSRLNMVYMICYFTAGAIGSYTGTLSWQYFGWNGVCALGGLMILLGAAVHTFTSLFTYNSSRRSQFSKERRTAGSADRCPVS